MRSVTVLEEIKKLYDLCTQRDYKETATFLLEACEHVYADLKHLTAGEETMLSDEKFKSIQEACDTSHGYSLWDLRLLVEEVLRLQKTNTDLVRKMELMRTGHMFGTNGEQHIDGIQTDSL